MDKYFNFLINTWRENHHLLKKINFFFIVKGALIKAPIIIRAIISTGTIFANYHAWKKNLFVRLFAPAC